MESGALRSQGAYQKQQYEFNAQMADMQAADAIRRGDKEASQVKARGKKMIGSQRAALAAQGIDVNSGSAADIQEETDVFSTEDAMTVRSNAWREAFGFRAQAMEARNSGAFAELAANNKASNTLLTGGMKAAGHLAQAGYYSYDRGGATPRMSPGSNQRIASSSKSFGGNRRKY